jgi:heme-degrading monooxygenase HmoA
LHNIVASLLEAQFRGGNFGQYRLIACGVRSAGKGLARCGRIQENQMIARTWSGTATIANADNYVGHFTKTVAPHLRTIAGHRGAWLLRRETGGRVEFLAVTLWDSLETIKTFAGPDPEVAIVEPEGRTALSAFDDFARHFDVAFSGSSGP